jgi:hypothetical protein
MYLNMLNMPVTGEPVTFADYGADSSNGDEHAMMQMSINGAKVPPTYNIKHTEMGT